MNDASPIPEKFMRSMGLGSPTASTEHHLTDLGNARRMVELHGDQFHWCEAWSRFLVWDGKRWKHDDTGTVERMAKETVQSIYHEAANARDPDLRKALAKHGARSEAASRLRAMIELARSEPGIPVVPKELDADPWLLNVENGHAGPPQRGAEGASRRGPDDKARSRVLRFWGPSPGVEAFLERVMPSEGLRRFVRRAITLRGTLRAAGGRTAPVLVA